MLRSAFFLSMVVLLTGCATALKPMVEGVQTEESWAASQRQANVQAVVVHDEEFIHMTLRHAETYAGAGPEIRAFRRVELMMVHSEGGKPFLSFRGIKRFAAVVPDGMPRLREGDIVEARYEGLYDRLKNFPQTKEGTAVLRMLCPSHPDRRLAPAFRQCASQLKWHEPWGEDQRYYNGVLASNSGRPYAAKLVDHTELVFTPYYDADGNVLPGAAPMAPRPDLASWPAPRHY